VILDPANRGALRVGVATHNLFEAAWALTVGRDRDLTDMIEMEMLEGMAPSMAASVRDEAGGLLLYAPVARRADSESVIAYLIRRFDENAGPENFLHHQFTLAPGSEVWEQERRRFQVAVGDRDAAFPATRRTQDRSRAPATGDRAHRRRLLLGTPPRRGLDRQPCLARAANASQSQEPRIADKPAERGKL